jgi:glutamyl-Q tRNA(Asp) synthetase
MTNGKRASQATLVTYRGRFAPSPTGPLHFGSLIAAVGSYLEARTYGGEWAVRIDDLDRARVAPGAVDSILRTLDECGMHWDGAVVYQSTRSGSYHAALHELRLQGRAYPCACSRREIADSAIAGIDGFVYPATCRRGLPAGRAARAWRIDTRGARVVFDDAVQGRVEHDVEHEFGDFVLYRSDSVYAYQLAASLDDAEQGITHVVRGADLLASTPRQIFLQRLLALPTPRYAHLPVAIDRAGDKLSKQTHAAPIDAARPGAALAAALRFLGHAPPHELEAAGVSALWQWAQAHWNLDRVPRVRTRHIEEPNLTP